MKRILTLTIFLALVVLGVGYFRGWFTVAASETDGKKGLNIAFDKDKFAADAKSAGQKIGALSKAAVDKIKKVAKSTGGNESEITGKILRVDAATQTVEVEAGGETIPLHLDAGATVTVAGKNVKLSELASGADVTVTLAQKDDGLVVRKVEAK